MGIAEHVDRPRFDEWLFYGAKSDVNSLHIDNIIIDYSNIRGIFEMHDVYMFYLIIPYTIKSKLYPIKL